MIKESDILLKISICKQLDVTLDFLNRKWCQLIVNIDFYGSLINFNDDDEWPHYVDIFGKKIFPLSAFSYAFLEMIRSAHSIFLPC